MKLFLSILFTLLTVVNLYSNTPTVGIAMSGGGAKGLYHIGVLKALEQEGIPIDYVTGTSMGAIVAALYSAGYSPEEMRQLAVSGQLEQWAMGRIDYRHAYYFEMESTLYRKEPMISFRIDPLHGESKKSIQENNTKSKSKRSREQKEARLPQSLIPSLDIDLALSEMFTPASEVCGGDFSKLMIPFLCVASDVTAAKEYIIKEGDLGLAVRSSMALPLAYSPVIREDGHVLYDGGLYDNLPWKPLNKHFNPDLLIASSCDIEYDDKHSSMSLPDQIFMLTTNERDYDLPENGIMIERAIPGGMMDFSRAEDIIAAGYDDTKMLIDSMVTKIGLKDRLPAGFYDKRRENFNLQKSEILLNDVSVDGLTKDQSNYVLRLFNREKRVHDRKSDTPYEVTFDELRSQLYPTLMGGEFNTSYPTVTRDSLDDSYNFNMRMSNKPELELSLGGNISSTPFNQIYLGVNYQTINRIAQTLFGELYIGPLYQTGRIGYRIDIYRKAPIFFDTYYNFSVKNLDHGNFGNLTPVDNAVDVKHKDNYISFGIGTPLMRRSQITLRGNMGSTSDSSDTQAIYQEGTEQPWLKYEKGAIQYVAGRLAIEHNTLNDQLNPTKGGQVTLSVIGVTGNEKSYGRRASVSDGDYMLSDQESYSSTTSWIGAKVTLAKYFTLDRNNIFSLGLNAEGVQISNPKFLSPQARRVALPYYAPLVQSNLVYMPEFAANRYIAAGGMCEVRLWRDLSLRMQGNMMLGDNYNELHEAMIKEGYDLNTIGQLSIIYKSPITSIVLAMTKYGLEDRNNLYLTFNLGWTIFSPRGIFY